MLWACRTALVGSGPAYIFMFIEAMVDSGVHMGFPRETAEKLVNGKSEVKVKVTGESSLIPPTTTAPGSSPAG